MSILEIIQNKVATAVKELYQLEIEAANVVLNPTRKEFEGDYTLVVFPFTKAAKKSPPALAEELGAYPVSYTHLTLPTICSV